MERHSSTNSFVLVMSPAPPSSTGGGNVGGAVSGNNGKFCPFVPTTTTGTTMPRTFPSASTMSLQGTATLTNADFGLLLANSSTLLSSMASTASLGGGRRTVGGGRGFGGGSVATSTANASLLVGGNGIGGGGGGRNMTTIATSYAEELVAHRLLSQKGLGFNASDLGRQVRDLKRRSFAGGIQTPTRDHVTSFGWEGGVEAPETENIVKYHLTAIDGYIRSQLNSFTAQ